MIKFTNAAMEAVSGGRAYLKLACTDRKEVEAFLEGFSYGKTWEIEPKEYHPKRSRNANAYAWALLDKLAAKLANENPGITAEGLYRDYIKDVPDNSVVTQPYTPEEAQRFADIWNRRGLGWQVDVLDSGYPVGTVILRCYYGSSFYDTAQMKRLLDLIIADCKEQGVETMTPDELAKLEGIANG